MTPAERDAFSRELAARGVYLPPGEAEEIIALTPAEALAVGDLARRRAEAATSRQEAGRLWAVTQACSVRAFAAATARGHAHADRHGRASAG
jgi:hypothetical protein